MTHHTRARLLLIVALLLVAAPAAADEIEMKGGGKLSNVRITEVTYEGMRWANKAGGQGLVRFDKIANATFDDSPWDYDKGLEAMKEGRYADALASFAKAMKSGDTVWVKQYCLWNIARCQVRLGKQKEAAEVLAKLVKIKKARYLPDAYLLRGRLALNAGDTAGALAAFKELSDLAQKEDAGLGKNYYYLGRAWMARTHLAGREAEKALELFRDLRTSTQDSFPAVYLLATIGEGQALNIKKEYSLARPLFNEAIEKARRDEAVLAQAYNGLGETYFHSGSEEELQKALKAFLKVILLFDEQATEVPKALWHASKCFGKLGANNKAWAARSRDLRRELQTRFPGSPWALKQ